MGNVYFLDDSERMSVQHGCFSQVECTLRLIEIAKMKFPHIDYFHLMSGQDYMCVSSSVFDCFFEKHKGESFMKMDTESEIAKWRYTKYKNRICTWHFGDLLPSKNLFVRTIKKGLQIVCNLFLNRPMMHDIVGGWNWFSWRKTVCDYVLDYLRQHPEYVKRFRYTHCCDELFFHTILYSLQDKLHIHGDNACRFIEWYPKRVCMSLPLVLEETEYEEIVASGSLICRKVHPVISKKLIVLLDERIALE